MIVAASAAEAEGVCEEDAAESFCEATLVSDVLEFFSEVVPEQLARRTAAATTGKRFFMLI